MSAKDSVKETFKAAKKLKLIPIGLIVIIFMALVVKLNDLKTNDNQTTANKVQTKTLGMYNTSSISAESDGTNRTICYKSKANS